MERKVHGRKNRIRGFAELENVVHAWQEVIIFYHLEQSTETTEGTERRVTSTSRLDPTYVESPSAPPEIR